MSEVPQHKKYAITGEIGQELADSKVGNSGGAALDRAAKTPLMDGGDSKSDTTLESGAGRNAKSPW